MSRFRGVFRRGPVWLWSAVGCAILGILLSLLGCASWYPVCILWKQDRAYKNSIEYIVTTCKSPTVANREYRCDDAYIYYSTKTDQICSFKSSFNRREGETGQAFVDRTAERYNNSNVQVFIPKSGAGFCVFVTLEREQEYGYAAYPQVQAGLGIFFCCLSLSFLVVWILWVVFKCKYDWNRCACTPE